VKLRHRHRLRRREVEEVNASIVASFGVSPFQGDEPIDRAEAGGFDVLIHGGIAVGLVHEGAFLPSVRLLLKHTPTRGHLTVDMGAVPFVANGADIMAPGIVEADPLLSVGSLAYIRDERNRRPMAIVRMLMPASELAGKPKGKAAKSIHYVGDEVWTLEA
jgi:PUA domain protein